MNAAPLDSLTYHRFSELVGNRFNVKIAAAEPIAFELRQVIGGRAGTNGNQFDNFSLFFHGPVEPVYAQATYRFEHETLGAFDLFIVPVGKDASATTYQAVFNRMS